MADGPDIARVAALIGDPARANMLAALMAGAAMTAGELADAAGVGAPTASAHLSKLVEGRLARVRKQGRHRYYEIADENAARMLEGLMGFAERAGHVRRRPGPRDPELRRARVCYNHLAGELGVRMFDSLRSRALLARDDDDRLVVTDAGAAFFERFGVGAALEERKRSPLCAECLDWSVRRPHLAGRLGRALLTQMFDAGWARRLDGARAVAFTPNGLAKFEAAFPN